MRKTCQPTAFDRITLQIDRYDRNAGGGRPGRSRCGWTGRNENVHFDGNELVQ